MDSVDTILNETARQLRETKRPKDREWEKKRPGRKSERCSAQFIALSFIIIHIGANLLVAPTIQLIQTVNALNQLCQWVFKLNHYHYFQHSMWIRLLLKLSTICLNRIEMNWRSVLPSTQEGAALVVPATCPGKQEHLTVCDRSSILFLLQQRWAAITSHVPAFTCTATKNTHTFHKNICLWMTLQSASHLHRHTCSQSFHHSLFPHRHIVPLLYILCNIYSWAVNQVILYIWYTI